MPTTISFYQKTSYYLSDTASKQSQVRKRMATAYAAFTSLMHLTTQLHQHPHPPIQLDEKQFDSLSSKICFFQRFLEDHHSTIDHESEIRIADAAHAAEDLIDTHIADRVPDFCGSLKRVIEHIDLIKKEMMAGMNQNEQSQQGTDRPARNPVPDASSQSPLAASGENEQSQQGSDRPPRYPPTPDASQPPSAASSENFTVGIEDITIDVVHKLTSKSDRQIISISGMGGIGKTTLARTVYEHPYIKSYFDFLAWATISKDYNTHASLLEILHCLIDRSESKKNLRGKSEHELGERIYKYLFGRRYLVVLDDIWDFEAWESMRSFFPACRGSGIVVTSRESKFASISSHSFRLDFLDEHISWDLFCKHVFGQVSCPDELGSVGKKIVKKCRGLPLSIAVIGSHLAKSPRKLEYWENIASNMSSVDDDHCLKIVSLSYIHLPVHLKPCFLYMAIFPEDKEIEVSRLIRLWVAEGFVKQINGKSLEDAARDYLNDLVDRNLILAFRSSRRGRMKRCKIHDLLRDFCLKEASKKNFICTVHKFDILKVTKNERRIVVHPSAAKESSTTDLLSEKQELSDSTGTQHRERIGPNEPTVNHHLDASIVLKARVLLRSLIFSGELPLIENKLLRVLAPYDEQHSREYHVSYTTFHELVNMRYFEFLINGYKCFDKLPFSISLLWNLQSLTIKDLHYIKKAPPEIWKMAQLRRIEFGNLILPHPPSEESNDIILENLQLAKTMMNFSFCEEIIKRIPNIKKLGVYYDDYYEGFEEGDWFLNNVNRLQKLESFECAAATENAEQSYRVFQNLTFPYSLKRLKVERLYWDDVTTKIGSLPLLEVLDLNWCTGPEWELVEGQFVKLKYLQLYQCDSLQYLTANNNHFPCLQRLLLHRLNSLEGISLEIGDITSLKSIELENCLDSAVISAKEIADEQYDLGNQDLQVTAELFRGNSSLSESLISTCNFDIRFY